MSFVSSIAFIFPPYQFYYPERKLTMEEMWNKFINEGKHEQEEMEIFINEFRTTNELLLKEQNNLLSELEIRVYELGRVMRDILVSRHEIKGVTTRGGKMMFEPTYSKYVNIDHNQPLGSKPNEPDRPNEVLVENEPLRFFHILIAPEDQEKTTFTCPYGTFAYRRMPFGLCNAPATFQRCMTTIFHDMVEDFMEVFMDDFLVFGNSFDRCLTNFDKMLTRCEETNLVLNWEKCHFMVKEGIVLGHKINGSGIEVDKAKIDAIAKLPYPTNVKGVRSFLGHAGFYRKFIKYFSMISKPMTPLLLKDVKFDFSDDCKKAFNILKENLTTASIIISLDWNIPFELMCDASGYAVGVVLGHCVDVKFKPIYYASKTLNNAQEHYTTTKKELLAVNAKPRLIRWVLLLQGYNVEIKDKKGAKNLAAYHFSILENPHIEVLTEREIADEFPNEHLMLLKAKLNDAEPWYANYVNYLVGKVVPLKWTSKKRKRFYSQVKNYFWDEPYAFKLCPDNIMRRLIARSEICEILAHCHSGPTGGHHSASVTGRKVYVSGFFWPNIFKDAKDYVIISMRAKDQEMYRQEVRCLKTIFKFGVPNALINDRGTHFGNSQLERALQKYGVTHKLLIAYHPHSNGQTEVTNMAIKRILKRSVGYNPNDWSEKHNDALWAFKTSYKTPTGCTPFRLVYGKACHLPVEIELKAYWALKQYGAYENTRIYKERTKKWHDSRLCSDKDFNVGDKVLLFNSRFKMRPGKLKSKWYGPNIVKTVYPYRAVEIFDKNGFSFKVNGNRLKKYYEGNVDKEDNEVIEFKADATCSRYAYPNPMDTTLMESGKTTWFKGKNDAAKVYMVDGKPLKSILKKTREPRCVAGNLGSKQVC
ncbi:putative nucleotidyltransferase, ribonuclease H [Tanacetum coccineum]